MPRQVGTCCAACSVCGRLQSDPICSEAADSLALGTKRGSLSSSPCGTGMHISGAFWDDEDAQILSRGDAHKYLDLGQEVTVLSG